MSHGVLAPVVVAAEDVAVDPVEELLQAIETLSGGLNGVEPSRIAEILRGELGQTEAVTEHRLETPIVHSSLVTDATIARGGPRSGEEWAWAFVRLSPTPGLTLDDLEARFDGHRHGIDLATVHGTQDGLPSIRHVNHRFEVDGGTLVASVSPDSVLVVQLVMTTQAFG